VNLDGHDPRRIGRGSPEPLLEIVAEGARHVVADAGPDFLHTCSGSEQCERILWHESAKPSPVTFGVVSLSWRHFAGLTLFVVASFAETVGVQASFQAETKIRADAKLIECLITYRKAADDYRHGDRSESTIRVTQLGAGDLGTVTAALLAPRKTRSKYAAPSNRSSEQLAPLLRWNSAALTAAAVLHLDTARNASEANRVDDATLHERLATVLFTALSNPLPGEADLEKRKSALAVGWFLLLQRKLRMAQEHFESAAKQWTHDAAIQQAYATVIETECSGPYPVLAPELLVPTRPLPGSRIEPVEINPYNRERSARMAMLRGAERVFELAQRFDPSSIETRIRLAHVHALQQKDTDAIALLEAVRHEVLPNEWNYIANLLSGAIYERGGHREKARAAYERALQLRPDGQVASIALSHLNYAADDGVAAAAALDRFFDVSANRSDPWWDYQLGLRTTADALFEKLRLQVQQ